VNRRLTAIRLIYRALLAAGILALLWAGGQLAYAKTYQLYLTSKLSALPLLENKQTGASLQSTPPLRSGDLVGRLDIAESRISVVVLEGVEDETLVVAAGHVPGTALPGSNGNIVIAAHRDTFFRKLREIHVGDRIQLSTARGTFGYSVSSTEIVRPSETRVLDSNGYPELTLITCYPFSFLGAAPQRFIVHANPSDKQSGNE
jgi:LPXTG-site transpeptidase (sortase) family protein